MSHGGARSSAQALTRRDLPRCFVSRASSFTQCRLPLSPTTTMLIHRTTAILTVLTLNLATYKLLQFKTLSSGWYATASDWLTTSKSSRVNDSSIRLQIPRQIRRGAGEPSSRPEHWRQVSSRHDQCNGTICRSSSHQETPLGRCEGSVPPTVGI